MKCKRCGVEAVVALPSHHTGFCESCFLEFFSRQIDKGIKSIGTEPLFTHDDSILIALSGGKDSLALALILHEKGYAVTGLHVDLDIPVSSPAARMVVENFCTRHSISLIIHEVRNDGLSIPQIKGTIRRPICAVCGKIKRYVFNKTALDKRFTVLATGHNLDDEIARLFSNTLRWDISYLSDQGPLLPAENGFAKKVKPLWRLSEFETANFAFLKGIDHHIAPCPYSAGASFTEYKRLWEDIEWKMPGRKLDFYTGFLQRGKSAFMAQEQETGDILTPCTQCSYPTSAGLCSICRLKATIAEAVALQEQE